MDGKKRERSNSVPKPARKDNTSPAIPVPKARAHTRAHHQVRSPGAGFSEVELGALATGQLPVDLQAPAPGGNAVHGSLYGFDLGVHDFSLGKSKIAGRQIMKQFGRFHEIRQKPRVEIFLMVDGCHDDSSIKIDSSWVGFFCRCWTDVAPQIFANKMGE